jgi:hypothetical protein
MLCWMRVNVTGVSVGHRVRCYSLISLRESSPPRTMNVPRTLLSLDRLRVTFSANMLTLSIGVSFSPRKTQGGFPQTFPVSTLKVRTAI